MMSIVLLDIDPEFFRFHSFQPEVDVGGNLLAVHSNYVPLGLWDNLQKMVVTAPKVK